MAMPKANSRFPKAYSVAELADRLDLSEKTLRRAIADGRLHAHHFGRVVRILHDDALAFLAVHRR